MIQAFFFIGGYNYDLYSSGTSLVNFSEAIYRFDTKNSTLILEDSLPLKLTNLKVVTIDSKIYFAGGYLDQSPNKSLYSYDFKNKLLSDLGSIPFSHINFLISNNNKIYALCCHYDGTTDSIGLYDPKLNTWKTNTFKMPLSKIHYTTISNIDSMVYLIGGRFYNNDKTESYTDIFYRGTISEYNTYPMISIQSTDNANEFYVFPNPFQDYLNIKKGISQDCSISIHSIDGRLIKKLPLCNSECKLDCSDLNAGVYFLKFDTFDKSYCTKIVKK